MMEKIVSVSHLSRAFLIKNRTKLLRSKKKTLIALNDVNFEINEGEMFGLLGPNGAGKTTITKILCTLLYPTKGHASVAGYDVVKYADKVRPIINMVAGGERMLYFRLTGRENLQYFADLYNIPKLGLKEKIDELLGTVGLLERADSSVEQYSKGMKQRLQFARALINDPLALFLDEPTLGLDVQVARELRELIKQKMVKNRITVLLTTHYLHEADELCDNVGILNNGEILAIEKPENLKKRFQTNHQILITVETSRKEILEDLSTYSGVQNVKIETPQNYPKINTNLWTVLLETDSEENISEILRQLLEKSDIQIYEVNRPTLSLEDAFIQIVARLG